MQEESKSAFDPHRVAVLYYFGDLTYWHLPQIAADAIERGHDEHALRGLARLTNPVQSDIRQHEVDAAFREMGVAAPISKEEARLILAAESATKAIRGDSNVFDEATHIRIHLCELKDRKTRPSHCVVLSMFRMKLGTPSAASGGNSNKN